MGLFSKSKFLCNPLHFASPVASAESDLRSCKEYDYVIVGGGTAGCVLASRLSEDPHVSVLLLEAGDSHKAFSLSNLFSSIPLAWPKLFFGAADWGYMTTPQKLTDDREWYWPRGKMLGGSSSINAGIYHRCAPEDFSAWTKEGATGWTYDEMKKYFIKAEKYIPNPERSAPDATTMHGASGPSTVTYGNTAPIMDKIINACHNVGIPKSSDFNTDNGTIGVGYFQGSVDEVGLRSSAATSYLTDDVVSRPNLAIGIWVRVEKIVVNTSHIAEGVIVSTKRDGPKYGVLARREVIMTSGTIGTPLVMMHSGLGPQEVLKIKGIKSVIDLPLVGRNLLDHVSTGPFIMRSTSEWTWDYLMAPLWTVVALFQWCMYGTKSPMASIAAQAACFIRSDDSRLPFGPSDTTPEDVTSGPNAPDIEIFFAPTIVIDNASKPPPSGEYGITFGPIVLKPKSKGTVEPASSNIWDGPLIDANYFSDRNDLQVLIRATKLCMHIARTEPLASCLNLKPLTENYNNVMDKFWPADANPDSVKDEHLEDWIKRNGSTAFHPTSTAKMGTAAENSVVNSDLKVHGVPKLRIVDASVFPTQVSGHTCAIVIALAERAADLIKEEYKNK